MNIISKAYDFDLKQMYDFRDLFPRGSFFQQDGNLALHAAFDGNSIVLFGYGTNTKGPASLYTLSKIDMTTDEIIFDRKVSGLFFSPYQANSFDISNNMISVSLTEVETRILDIDTGGLLYTVNEQTPYIWDGVDIDKSPVQLLYTKQEDFFDFGSYTSAISNNYLLISGRDAEKAYIYNAVSGTLLYEKDLLEYAVRDVEIFGNYGFIGYKNNQITIFDISTGDNILSIDDNILPSGFVVDGTIVTNGQHILLSNHSKNDLHVFDINSQELVNTISLGSELLYGPDIIHYHWSNEVVKPSVAMNNDLIAVGMTGKYVNLYSIETGELVKTFLPPTGGSSAHFGINVSLSDDYLAISSSGHLDKNPDELYDIAFFERGTFGGSVHIYDINSMASYKITGSDEDGTLTGDVGDDMIIAGLGHEKIDGGDGNDTLDYSESRFRVDIDLLHNKTSNAHTSSTAYGDEIFNVENIIVTHRDDVVYGTHGDNIIHANDGNDKVWGRNGDDTIHGGNGQDEIYGGIGNDIILGGNGNDFIAGFSGDDLLYGNDGDDLLYGQSGADIYYGGSGKDYMYSGGRDGAKDTFIFTDAAESVIGSGDNRDRIVGFEVGIDEIDLAALGTQSASAIASGLGTNVYLVNISGNTDFEIVVTTTGGTLTSSDIVT